MTVNPIDPARAPMPIVSAQRVASTRFVSLDVLRGIAILLMIFSGMIPKTLPSWMDHGYQPHFKPNAAGVWVSALSSDGDAVFDGRWKAMTWVDLVFPMFLFSMGAAIPIAMARRLERGESKISLARTVVARWLTLIFFAVILDHIGPPASETLDDTARRLMLLAGFGIAFLFFVRWPAAMPVQAQRGVRLVSGLVLVVLAAAYAFQGATLADTTPGRDGLRFAWQSDTIIMVLAHSYLVAGLAWLVIPRWSWLRYLLLVPLMLFAHYLQLNAKGADHNYLYADWQWMGDWPMTRPLFSIHGQPWTLLDVVQSPKLVLNLPHLIGPLGAAASSRPWLGQLTNLSVLWDFTWYKFMWIVMPGTIVGDWLIRRSRETPAALWIDPNSGEVSAEFERANIALPRGVILALAILAIALTCVGLRHYGFNTIGIGGPLKTPYFALTFAIPALLATAVVAVVRLPRGEWLVRRLCVVGAAFGIVGLVLACMPWHKSLNGIFEGGINKGPPGTLSYYFTSVGLCMQLLAGLFAMFDSGPHVSGHVGFIEANGQNPLLVYFLDHVTIAAIFGLAVFAPFHPAGTADSWWSRIQSLDDLGHWPDHPWYGAAWGAFKTLLIAAFVWILTRRRIFWRA